MNNVFKVGSGGRGRGRGKEKWGEGEVGERGKVDGKNIFLEEFSFGL